MTWRGSHRPLASDAVSETSVPTRAKTVKATASSPPKMRGHREGVEHPHLPQPVEDLAREAREHADEQEDTHHPARPGDAEPGEELLP